MKEGAASLSSGAAHAGGAPRRAGGVAEEGEFAAFINMCAKTDAAKREKPTSRKGVGFSLRSRKNFLSAQKIFREHV